MTSDLLAAGVVNLLLTYLLHSTLLLGAATIFVWCCRPKSHVLAEQLWKSAAVIPLLTAPLQSACGLGMPVFDTAWNEPQSRELVKNGVQIPLSNVEAVESTFSPDEPLVGEALPAEPHETESPGAAVPLEWVPPAAAPPLILSDNGGTDELVALAPALEAPADIVQIPELKEAASIPPHPVPLPQRPVAKRPAIPRLLTWTAGLAIFVFAGGLLRVLIASGIFHRNVQTFQPVKSGPLHDILVRLARRAKLSRSVRLLESGHLSEPIAFGMRRWTIAVPRGIADQISDSELEALLAHELAHLIRGDAWWLHFGRLLCGCLPFQPLNFLARAKWRQAAEFQCDDWAAERTNNPLTLAHCLTNIAEWRLDAAGCPPALPAGGSESTLTRRVERLLAERPSADPWTCGRRKCALTMAALAVSAALCLHGPRAMLRAEGRSDPAEAAPSRAIHSLIDGLPSATDLERLEIELRQVERDLRRVDMLMQDRNVPPEVKSLAVRLSARLADLRRHRRELFARLNAESLRSIQSPE